MSRYLSPESPATVLDPACGEGDLLAAVADEFGTHSIHFVGIDSNPKALAVCKDALEARGADITLQCSDFFECDLVDLWDGSERVYATMNPPFKGYGRISARRRENLLKVVPSLKGRYNLAQAFLVRTLTELHPKSVFALLPGSWAAASYNHLRYLVDHPLNSWRTLPESTFDGATTTTGLLILRNPDCQAPDRRPRTPKKLFPLRDIRQGVATGADAAYIRIASRHPTSGRVVRVARGRDIAANRSDGEMPMIWVPPKRETKALASFVRTLAELDAEQLANRFCVKLLAGAL